MKLENPTLTSIPLTHSQGKWGNLDEWKVLSSGYSQSPGLTNTFGDLMVLG